MKLCIDTNTYEAFKRKNQTVISYLEQADSVVVPSIVLGELYSGFYRGRKTERNIVELQMFMETPGIEEVAVTGETAERYGLIIRDIFRNGTPIPTNDVWISAIAIETASRLLSFDKHFDLVPGLLVIHPD